MQDKKFKWITSLMILLPCVAGLLLWDALPDQIPTHFGSGGNPDGWSEKPLAVFGIPLLLLGLHWLMLWGVKLDRRNVSRNEKMMKIILGIFPVMSLVISGIMYGIALDKELNISRFMLVLLGLLFAGTGNYLPKCQQNATMGIKLPWTLYNEENWNRTHRFGGWCWMAAGMSCVVCGLVSENFGWILPVMVAVAVVPMVYSWLLYKKQVREGTWVRSEYSRNMAEDPNMQRLRKAGIPVVALVLVLVAVLMFTGDISVSFEADRFVVDAAYSDTLTVEYAAVKSVEYRDETVGGTREWGFASARLLMGVFRNTEFGQYLRYTYTGNTGSVIVELEDEILVISGRTTEETEQIASELSERLTRGDGE